jgi:hypothetical protein
MPVNRHTPDDADDADDPFRTHQKNVVMPPSRENFRMSKKQTPEMRLPPQAGQAWNPPPSPARPSSSVHGNPSRQSSHRLHGPGHQGFLS